jgi:hypothetical protein
MLDSRGGTNVSACYQVLLKLHGLTICTTVQSRDIKNIADNNYDGTPLMAEHM